MTAGAGRTVVVVDDSPATRALLSELATVAGGTRVEACANGFEAMRALPRIDDLALVITDVNMPDITGLELVRYIREQDRFRGVPVYVVSTDSAKADLERAMKLGATRYFVKPFDVEALGRAVREALES